MCQVVSQDTTFNSLLSSILNIILRQQHRKSTAARLALQKKKSFMRWRKMGCPMKKEPSAIGMMDFPLENGRIFTIRGPLQNIWTRENMERTGQTPAEIC